MKYFILCFLLIALMGCQMSHQDYPKIDSNGLAHHPKVGEFYQTTARLLENGSWSTFFEASISTKALIFEWENLNEFPELQNSQTNTTKTFFFRITKITPQADSYNEILKCHILKIP